MHLSLLCTPYHGAYSSHCTLDVSTTLPPLAVPALREGIAFITYIPMSKMPMMEQAHIKYQLDDSANRLSPYLTSDPTILDICMIPQILF